MLTHLWIRLEIALLEVRVIRIENAILRSGLPLADSNGYPLTPKELQPLYDRQKSLVARQYQLRKTLPGRD